jgi:hypothetical protein
VLKITPFAASDPPALVEFFAYDPGFRGGIRVAVGDVDGSGLGSIVLGAGPGGGPHVRALKYVGGGPAGLVEVASFMVYDPGLTSGIYVATGDVNGDGRSDIVTGVGPGGGPHVRAVTRNPDGSVTELASFFAYDPGARAGMRVATVRLNPGDGVDTILTVPGPGSGPHVKAFKWAGAGVPPAEVASFFAYPPGFLGGAFVAGTR